MFGKERTRILLECDVRSSLGRAPSVRSEPWGLTTDDVGESETNVCRMNVSSGIEEHDKDMNVDVDKDGRTIMRRGRGEEMCRINIYRERTRRELYHCLLVNKS